MQLHLMDYYYNQPLLMPFPLRPSVMLIGEQILKTDALSRALVCFSARIWFPGVQRSSILSQGQ